MTSFTQLKHISTKADFAELRKRVAAEGLLEKDSKRFLLHFACMTILWLAGWSLVFLVDNIFIQILNAVFLAFVFGQFGFLHHDAGHDQVFEKRWKNSAAGYACSFFMGSSFLWWRTQHNEHHANPNHEDEDPDIQIPILAYSESQARSKKGLSKLIVRNQAYLFFAIELLTTIGMRKTQTKFMLSKPFKEVWIDLTLSTLHVILYLVVIFTQLPVVTAIVFLLIQQGLWGLYLGSVFAPNHKGMEMFEKDDHPGFLLQQILSSRNMKGNRFIDFWYGGLNYQIEHHLFPYMPRHRYPQTQKIVKQFCKEKEIPYHETGFIQGWREILGHMHEIGQFAK